MTKAGKPSTKGAAWVPATCSRGDLSVILDVSVRTVGTYAQKGLLVEAAGRGRYQTLPSIKNVINSLRESATNKASSTGLSLQDERALTEKVEREIKALKLAELRGEVLTLAEVLDSWSAFAGNVKGAILSIPAKARTMIPHLTTHDGGVLRDMCRDVLQDLSEEVSATVIHGNPKDLKKNGR